LFGGLEGKRLLEPGEEPDFRWFKDGCEFDPDEKFKVLFRVSGEVILNLLSSTLALHKVFTMCGIFLHPGSRRQLSARVSTCEARGCWLVHLCGIHDFREHILFSGTYGSR